MKIQSEIVEYTKYEDKELITYELTFPRIILPEVLTHRAFSRNTSSSRAIPFKKMVEIVKKDPFIPIAWQKSHKGMQGKEYFTKEEIEYENLKENWLNSLNQAIGSAEALYQSKVTKQICNRLLEPFTWVKMLVTTSKKGLENFFELRCPKLIVDNLIFRSRLEYPDTNIKDSNVVKLSASNAEIHMQLLAESMYNNYITTLPKALKGHSYHIPYRDSIEKYMLEHNIEYSIKNIIILSIAKAARVSYTTIEGNRDLNLEESKRIFEHCKENKHMSVFEHVALLDEKKNSYYNLDSYMSLRYMIENGLWNGEC